MNKNSHNFIDSLTMWLVKYGDTLSAIKRLSVQSGMMGPACTRLTTIDFSHLSNSVWWYNFVALILTCENVYSKETGKRYISGSFIYVFWDNLPAHHWCPSFESNLALRFLWPIILAEVMLCQFLGLVFQKLNSTSCLLEYLLLENAQAIRKDAHKDKNWNSQLTAAINLPATFRGILQL